MNTFTKHGRRGSKGLFYSLFPYFCSSKFRNPFLFKQHDISTTKWAVTCIIDHVRDVVTKSRNYIKILQFLTCFVSLAPDIDETEYIYYFK